VAILTPGVCNKFIRSYTSKKDEADFGFPTKTRVLSMAINSISECNSSVRRVRIRTSDFNLNAVAWSYMESVAAVREHGPDTPQYCFPSALLRKVQVDT
jgi:hypothetical protein